MQVTICRVIFSRRTTPMFPFKKTFYPGLTLSLFFGLFLLAGCDKPVDQGGNNGGIKYPKIISYSPSDIKTGTSVTLTGENYGTVLSEVVVMLGTTSVSPVSVSNQSIVFTVPANLLSSGSGVFDLLVMVAGQASNTIKVTVTYVVQEQRGWYYTNKDMSSRRILPSAMYFYDDPYKVGLVFGQDLLLNSSTDGASWGGIFPESHWGSAFHVYDDDEAWIETNFTDIWVYNYDYFNATAKFARLDTITSIPALRGKAISGVYITSRNTGYVLTHEGSVFKINGSFAPSAISLEYQASHYTNLPLTYANNYYSMTGLDSNNLLIAGFPKVNGAGLPMLVLKRKGIYQEYDLSNMGVGWAYRLQYADENNIFFLSLNYELFKLNVTTNTWVKLNTPRFNEVLFINGSTGYASTAWEQGLDYYYIYKTTDGGNTWKVAFALDRFHYVYRMCHKNNKLWVIGESIFSLKNFGLKYNP